MKMSAEEKGAWECWWCKATEERWRCAACEDACIRCCPFLGTLCVAEGKAHHLTGEDRSEDKCRF